VACTFAGIASASALGGIADAPVVGAATPAPITCSRFHDGVKTYTLRFSGCSGGKGFKRLSGDANALYSRTSTLTWNGGAVVQVGPFGATMVDSSDCPATYKKRLTLLAGIQFSDDGGFSMTTCLYQDLHEIPRSRCVRDSTGNSRRYLTNPEDSLVY
jgi:hypothetical protein